jgi:hypothetical protein
MGVIAWFEGCDPKCWPQANGAAKENIVPTAATEKSGMEGDIQQPDVMDFRRKKVEEVQSWLDKVVKWETFVLDARIGMRVQTGLEVLKWWKKKMGVA